MPKFDPRKKKRKKVDIRELLAQMRTRQQRDARLEAMLALAQKPQPVVVHVNIPQTEAPREPGSFQERATRLNPA